MGESVTETKPPLKHFFPPKELNANGSPLEKPFVASSFWSLIENGSPSGKRMLVIGSGPNTQFWQNRGAETLDIDSQWQSDFTTDANNFTQVTGENAFDIILSECVTINPEGKKGVNFERLVQQIAKALKPNGELFIQSATFNILPNQLVPQDQVRGTISLLSAAKFQRIAVFLGELIGYSENWKSIGDKVVINDFYLDAQVIYYGKKPRKAS